MTFTGSPTDMGAVIHGGAPFDLITIEGDMALAGVRDAVPIAAQGCVNGSELRRARLHLRRA